MSYDPLSNLQNSVSNAEIAEKARDKKHEHLFAQILTELRLIRMHLAEITDLDVEKEDLVSGRK